MVAGPAQVPGQVAPGAAGAPVAGPAQVPGQVASSPLGALGSLFGGGGAPAGGAAGGASGPGAAAGAAGGAVATIASLFGGGQ